MSLCNDCGDVMVWPGYIYRDDLAQFVRQRAPEIEKENDKILEAMRNPRLSDDDYETLNNQYYSNLGRLREMRTITDWAAENNTKDEEMESQNV